MERISEEDRCPNCNNFITGVTEMNDIPGVRPKPGDFSCCFECGQVLRFTEDMKQIKSDLSEAFMHMPLELYLGFRKVVQQIERIYKRKQE